MRSLGRPCSYTTLYPIAPLIVSRHSKYISESFLPLSYFGTCSVSFSSIFCLFQHKSVLS